LPLTASSFY
jgi:hypothetical protein